MKIYTSIISAFILISVQFVGAQNTTLTSASIGKLEARSIGPAVTGGRITSIIGVNSDPRIMYVGTAGGGIWKTTNGGSQFKPIFDKHPQSIGDITIDQKNPDVIWVGTGESNMRNSVSIGKGIYKSTDAGDNWICMGLEKTEHISKVVLDPRNTEVIYVSAPGALWNDSPDRGLYKTTDGGKTWNKILFVDEHTGCADVVINPKNPDIIYASMWEFRRKPYAFNSGGKGSGLYKSIDGGKTWKKIQNGLAEGDLGRIAISVSPVNPDNLVIICEAKKTGLYISTDAGENWKAQSADDNVTARPFYFSCIAFDLLDPKRVYRPAFQFSYSTDGGYSWIRAQNSSGWVHSDMHALWINPQNPSHLYVGTDGGVYMSVDRGNNWMYLNNMPIAQAYHVQIDNQEPYNVYAGFQDNGSWKAPSQSVNGIDNGDWMNVGGGDGFWVQPDPQNNNIIYSEYQGGHAQRLNIETNQGQDIQPQAKAGEEKLRWNWNTPIYVSPSQPSKLYMAAQYLFRSENKGITWTQLGNDLTTNDPAKKKQDESGGLTNDNTSAENHCTIFTVAESPLDATMIFVGTDDGNLQISRDNGTTWENYADNYKQAGIPAQTWISSIEPSKFDKNVLYATFDNHMYGDMKTYVAKSSDGGHTWALMTSNVFKGFAHKIKEDLQDKNILFLGTEWGLYTSIDGGISWIQMKAKVPDYVAVRDIQIDPKSNDLVLGTHGRGILIIDNIALLRELNKEVLNSAAKVLNTKLTPITTGHYGGSWPSAGGFTAPNSTEEAIIKYYLKDRVNSGDVKVQILDASGNLVTELPGTKRKGINIITWNMRSKPPRVAEGGGRADWSGTVGPFVKPGVYKIKLLVGEASYDGSLTLTEDKNAQISINDRTKNYEAVDQVFKLQENLASLMDSVLSIQRPIQALIKQGKASDVLRAYNDSLEVIRKILVPVKEGGNVAFVDEDALRDRLSELYFGLSFYEGKPTDSQLEKIGAIQYDMNEADKKFKKTKLQFQDQTKEELKPPVKKGGPY
ncbi:MAG: glycosyl hydrolase [Bacteroidota bacterium]